MLRCRLLSIKPFDLPRFGVELGLTFSLSASEYNRFFFDLPVDVFSVFTRMMGLGVLNLESVLSSNTANGLEFDEAVLVAASFRGIGDLEG
ncbi:hypothetical protein H310_10953 [Aphanomyces invadans]|uniref:Uncharacterized protein n=1 Tax=Aphanomyces invadans TaxID=157072 RepID=A0A024TQ79_9STRA|nr:hypothetical protein H310_10953 [Aphanomyces invadans]ETV95482.1 hypothetical protein H310_10953 [Aphanomyces invadans]|eukprot:XP_008875675.1 hypothetical protein H310_10953 [Aphanomyces invadans]